jgi:hypothetical protein
MNGVGPPKKERGLATTLKTAELMTAYRVLAFLQAPFGFVFWKIEQAKAHIDVEQERRRT